MKRAPARFSRPHLTAIWKESCDSGIVTQVANFRAQAVIILHVLKILFSLKRSVLLCHHFSVLRSLVRPAQADAAFGRPDRFPAPAQV
jgi:hypothetical protein